MWPFKKKDRNWYSSYKPFSRLEKKGGALYTKFITVTEQVEILVNQVARLERESYIDVPVVDKKGEQIRKYYSGGVVGFSTVTADGKSGVAAYIPPGDLKFYSMPVSEYVKKLEEYSGIEICHMEEDCEPAKTEVWVR